MAHRGSTHEWRHGWIPLTPASALIKAKGSRTGAARLRRRHGVDTGSTRNLVRSARQTSLPDQPRARQAEVPTPDTTVAAQRRRAAVERMSDADLENAARRHSNGQTLRFIREEQAKRRAAGASASKSPHELKAGDRASVRGTDQLGQPTSITGTVVGNTPQTIYKRGRTTGGQPVRAIEVRRQGASGMDRTDVVYVPDPNRGEQRRGAAAQRESARAAALRDQAAAERAKLQGIADRAGPPTTDPQANRLSARGLKQAHRNTDSSLRRYTETQQRANALESKAHLAEARAKEAGRTRLTRADVEGATHIVDQHGQAREVVRVNGKTVTVKTPYSWTETVPIDKIRRAIKATPEQIAEAKRRAALRVAR